MLGDNVRVTVSSGEKTFAVFLYEFICSATFFSVWIYWKVLLRLFDT